MPAGLDGNARPITTVQRQAVLAAISGAVAAIDKSRVLVAVDGASGVGKSTFGDELASWLVACGRVVVRSTTDSFHRPRAERYRRGPTSPEGYYLDSHDLVTIERQLLEPFSTGAARVQVTAFDEPANMPRISHVDVAGHSVLVFDGLFLLRTELRRYLDLTIFLQAQARRQSAWNAYLRTDLPRDDKVRTAEIERRLEQARWPRYREGWQLYLDDADPEKVADFVVDNDDLARPRPVRTPS